MTRSSYRYFLFPLPNFVFLTRTVVPLNIFEPRYIKMIHDSLDQDIPIALCPRIAAENPNYVSYSETICGFGKAKILKENPDKTLIVAVKNMGKLVLAEQVQTIPYRIYTGMPLRESEDLEIPNRFRLNRLKNTFMQWIEDHVGEINYDAHFFKKIKQPADLIAYAAFFMLPAASQKQHFLTLNDINGKLDFLLQCIEGPDFNQYSHPESITPLHP